MKSLKLQRKLRIRNMKLKKTNDDLMSKMAMVICHAHFHRITNGVSYIRMLKELCARNNLPYVTPLDTNPDSRKTLQTLSEQCEDYNQRVESATEEDRISSEEENNADSDNETENPRKERQLCQVQTRAQSKANQMKLRDLSKERREEEANTQEPSTSYAEAASN